MIILEHALIGLRRLRTLAADLRRRVEAAYEGATTATRRPWGPPSPEYSLAELCEIFPTTDPTLVERFWQYHQTNPHVFREFRVRAAEMKATGQTRYSGWVIINRIRWDHDLKTWGDPFKINNDYIALYARLLIHEDKDFDGFFELRKMKGSGRQMSQEEAERRARDASPNLELAFDDRGLS